MNTVVVNTEIPVSCPSYSFALVTSIPPFASEPVLSNHEYSKTYYSQNNFCKHTAKFGFEMLPIVTFEFRVQQAKEEESA